MTPVPPEPQWENEAIIDMQMWWAARLMSSVQSKNISRLWHSDEESSSSDICQCTCTVVERKGIQIN